MSGRPVLDEAIARQRIASASCITSCSSWSTPMAETERDDSDRSSTARSRRRVSAPRRLELEAPPRGAATVSDSPTSRSTATSRAQRRLEDARLDGEDPPRLVRRPAAREPTNHLDIESIVWLSAF